MSVHIGESEDCSSFDGGEGERYLPCCTSGLNTARLTIVVGDKHFSEERLLLVQSCDYFQALCRSGMKECQQEEIHLRSLHAQGFIITLAVLHGEMPILDGDDIVEAIECGAFLQVTSLTKHLINLCDADNCLLMYHPAATLGLIDLYHTAALFIRDMYADLEEEVRKTLPLELITYVESLTPSVFVAVGAHVTCCVDETVHAASRTISYLDETGNTWKVLIDLPLEASTSMAGVTVLDNKLYIIGGVHGVYKQIVDSCFCYSVESSSWSSIPSPAQLHYNLNLVGADGYLYAIGGEYEQTVMSSVETYNVKLQFCNSNGRCRIRDAPIRYWVSVSGRYWTKLRYRMIYFTVVTGRSDTATHTHNPAFRHIHVFVCSLATGVPPQRVSATRLVGSARVELVRTGLTV
uniref:Si:ch211-253p14.2 n=1 Tax=Stegastes partitus TaxID=144197 RepID=A0A3B5B6N1_9TELE